MKIGDRVKVVSNKFNNYHETDTYMNQEGVIITIDGYLNAQDDATVTFDDGESHFIDLCDLELVDNKKDGDSFPILNAADLTLEEGKEALERGEFVKMNNEVVFIKTGEGYFGRYDGDTFDNLHYPTLESLMKTYIYTFKQTTKRFLKSVPELMAEGAEFDDEGYLVHDDWVDSVSPNTLIYLGRELTPELGTELIIEEHLIKEVPQ